MSTNAILTGFGLVIVLAIAAQLVAGRLRLPAIVILLPVGFAAGAITADVHPDNLLGDAFQPLVSLGVGLILFEAGLRLRVDELRGDVRRTVWHLIAVGTLITLVGVTAAVKPIFGLSLSVSVLIGAILVVSGPTVVLPLLEFVRPSDRVRTILKWEGVLIDPIGALLGVIFFHAVQQGAAGGRPFHPGMLALSLGIGLLVGIAAAAVLGVLLRVLQRSAPQRGVTAALMVVAAALVSADLIREDAGFVATTVMGIAMANQRRIDVSQILEFHGTVVNLLIGMLFVLISASVTPSDVREILPEGLALIAVMVLVVRPLAVAFGTWRSELSVRERAFAAWMAPRGIVAAATASAFGIELTQQGVAGADRILPIVFVVIFGTVVLYGLTATAVARLLGVAGEGAPVVLIVGGHPWARAIASALKEADIAIRLWTGDPEEQEAARAAGLDAGQARLGVDRATREAELEEVSDALLVTDSDDFNALAAFELRQELGSERVYRLAPDTAPLDLVPSYAEGGILFARNLTFDELSRRFSGRARLVSAPAEPEVECGAAPGRRTPLFLVSERGSLRVITADATPRVDPGDTAIVLADA